MSETLNDLADLGAAAAPEAAVVAEPKIDALGRAYATGRRKESVARVWIKPGSGVITVNGKDVSEYFARPVLQMVLKQPMQIADRLQVALVHAHDHVAGLETSLRTGTTRIDVLDPHPRATETDLPHLVARLE